MLSPLPLCHCQSHCVLCYLCVLVFRFLMHDAGAFNWAICPLKPWLSKALPCLSNYSLSLKAPLTASSLQLAILSLNTHVCHCWTTESPSPASPHHPSSFRLVVTLSVPNLLLLLTNTRLGDKPAPRRWLLEPRHHHPRRNWTRLTASAILLATVMWCLIMSVIIDLRIYERWYQRRLYSKPWTSVIFCSI